MKSKPINKSLILMAIMAICYSQGSSAASFTGKFTVKSIVVDADRYAGCMVKVSPGPETIFNGCQAGFVSFGCDGNLGISKSQGNQLLNAAQLGFVMNRQVVLRINDENAPVTSRGYCLADRVDVTKN